MSWSMRRDLLLAAALVFPSSPAYSQQPAAPRENTTQPPRIESTNERRESAGERPESEPEREEPKEEKSEIETDRDSFTPATTTAGRRRLIFETAHTFVDNRGVKETNSFPESLLRYGLTDRLELRLGWNYEVGGAGSDVSGVDASGDEVSSTPGLERDSRLSYGLKLQLTKPECWIPGSAFILQAATPTSGLSSDTQVFGTYVVGWELPNKWKLDSALRYGTGSEEADHYKVWAPSIVVKAPIGEKISVHAEYFSIISNGKAEEFTRHYFSPGLHYLINENFEIGFRLGWGLNDQAAKFFSNVGIGLRF